MIKRKNSLSSRANLSNNLNSAHPHAFFVSRSDVRSHQFIRPGRVHITKLIKSSDNRRTTVIYVNKQALGFVFVHEALNIRQMRHVQMSQRSQDNFQRALFSKRHRLIMVRNEDFAQAMVQSYNTRFGVDRRCSTLQNMSVASKKGPKRLKLTQQSVEKTALRPSILHRPEPNVNVPSMAAN